MADPYYTLEYSPSSPGRIATWSTHSGIVSDVSRIIHIIIIFQNLIWYQNGETDQL